MTDKCPHGWTTPPECPSCMAMELDALRDSDVQLHARNEMLFSELEFLTKEREKLRAMVIRRDRAIQRIHNHAYDPQCSCAVCSMYAAEGWEVI